VPPWPRPDAWRVDLTTPPLLQVALSGTESLLTYSESRAALRASARSWCTSRRVILPSLMVRTWMSSWSDRDAAALSLPNELHGSNYVVSRVDELPHFESRPILR
jgi:hypothetical protein